MNVRIYLVGAVSLFLYHCSPGSSIKQPETIQEPAQMVKQTQTDSLQNIIVELQALQSHADIKLTEGDTLGAEIYLDQATNIISEFSEEVFTTLSADSGYILVSKQIFTQQKTLFNKDIDLEELADFRSLEEFRLADEDATEDSTLTVETETDSVTYTIPVTLNAVVQRHMNYLLGKRGRKTMQRWLERGQLIEPLIKQILHEEGVPEDLYFLAMIESGFNPNAKSWASAVGPWQFIKATGKYYGLHASYWADDRRDIEKSTRAAARHLKDLYKRFDDWYLAMAGYNCNPAKIARRVRQQNTRDYFKLKNIPRETRGYVPQFIAAMVIGKQPEKYGFFIEKEEPLSYDRIFVKDVIDLNHIAKASNTDFQEIKHLNPAILKWVTPSDRDSMYVNVPKGYGEKVLAFIDSLPSDQKEKYIRYQIKSGDALSLIARNHGVSVAQIKKINKMNSTSIRAGKYLIIPVPADPEYFASLKKKQSKKRVYKAVPGHERVNYRVKPGDTLGHIAEAYNTHAKKIRQWNGLRFRESIRVGQTLVLWVKDLNAVNKASFVKKAPELNRDLYVYHKVKSGETLWDISKKYETPIPDLKRLNQLNGTTIRQGAQLIIKEK